MLLVDENRKAACSKLLNKILFTNWYKQVFNSNIQVNILYIQVSKLKKKISIYDCKLNKVITVKKVLMSFVSQLNFVFTIFMISICIGIEFDLKISE